MRFERKLRRQCGVKKLIVLIALAILGIYLTSVVQRTQEVVGVRKVWGATAGGNYSDGMCGPECGAGEISFYMRTGWEKKLGPVICFQQKLVVHSKLKNTGRGLTVVIVDEKTLTVELVRNYDTYLDDYDFIHDMKTNVKSGNLAFVASFDEMSDNLGEEGHRWIKMLGSDIIDELQFRDAFFLVGQVGLKQGRAIEFISRRGQRQYAKSLEKMGCISLPMGQITPTEKLMPKLVMDSQLKKLGVKFQNCGMKSACGPETFSVMVDTAQDSKSSPEICVNGRMIMDGAMKNSGRGLNVVVVNPRTNTPRSAARYDTYIKGSANLALMLDSLVDGDIIIVVASDDASRKLENNIRDKFNELGSSMAQNLKFRDVWYFVGQKGIDGFSTFEKISYAGFESEWPTPLKESFCVPRRLLGSETKPDPISHRNDARREFCKKYDGYGEFCDSERVDDMFIKPIQLVDEQLQRNPVYSSPIVIVPGFNHNALVKTMETTMMQPGVNPNNVVVAWDDKFPEHGDLATYFGFRNISIDSSIEYSDHVLKSIEKVARLFPESKYLIVLEEELILSPDFLYFMAQCSEVLDKDDSLIGASAFNYYGFENLSGNKSLVYRVHEFPGLGFMLKTDVYRDRMKGILKFCCNVRVWEGWSLPMYNFSHFGDILVPDLSRVYRQVYEGMNKDEDYLINLFNTPRGTNLDRTASLAGLGELGRSQYDAVIKDYLATAKPLTRAIIRSCSLGNQKLQLELFVNYVLYYEQRTPDDYSVLIKVSPCFNLVVMDRHPPRNMYKGVIRMTYNGNNIILVGSKSVFADFKPEHVKFLKGS